MSKRYFPFHPLGLRSNPFRALTREEWSEVALIPPQVTEILAQDLSHLQIIGEQGTGKTSALLALKQHYAEQGRRVQYRYLPAGEKRFRGNLRTTDILFLDEMQRLSKIQRTRLVRKIARNNDEGTRLISSTHEDLTPLFESHSRLLETVHLDRHEERFMRQIIQRRLQYFAIDKRSKTRLTEDAFRFLHETFQNDLRSLEYFLYDYFQQQISGGKITSKILGQAMGHYKPTPERG